jgi:hypothetical protein
MNTPMNTAELLAHLRDAHSVEVTETELRFFGTHSLPLDTDTPFHAAAFHADLHERATSSPHEHHVAGGDSR